MRKHSTSYRNRLSASLADVQPNGEYPVDYGSGVRKNGYLLRIDQNTSLEKRGDRPSSQNDGDDVIIEAVVPPSNRSPSDP